MPAPLLIPIAALAMQAVGTGLSLYGNYSAQKAQDEALKKAEAEKKRVAKLNYEFQSDVAVQNQQAALLKADQYAEKGDTFLSTQKATGATSGALAGGSASVVQSASRNNIREDVNLLRDEANQQYRRHMKQAKIDLEAGSPTYTGGMAGLGMQQWGTALTATSNIIGQGYNMGLWGR